jgi:hypothetical protein
MTTPKRPPPVVPARRVPTRDCDLLVIQCPYCGREHVHGAGEPGSPHGSADGHRVGHCGMDHWDEAGIGYVLQEEIEP